MKGLNLRRKVSQLKIVLKIKLLDNLETLFFILLQSSYFHKEAGNFSRHCLLRFKHIVNYRKCRKGHNIDTQKQPLIAGLTVCPNMQIQNCSRIQNGSPDIRNPSITFSTMTKYLILQYFLMMATCSYRRWKCSRIF